MNHKTRNRSDGNGTRRLMTQMQQARLPDGRHYTRAYGVSEDIAGTPQTVEGPEDCLAVMRDLIAPAMGKRDFVGCMEEEVETDGNFHAGNGACVLRRKAVNHLSVCGP